VTVAVTPEVHATFKRLSKAGSMSVSRTMGDWLGDTIEAAEFMAQKMEQARAAPKIVMREMHAYAMGLADETGEMIDRIKKRGVEERAAGALARDARPLGTRPPSGNTGGKGTENSPGTTGKVAKKTIGGRG
jgi:hypothetical protein